MQMSYLKTSKEKSKLVMKHEDEVTEKKGVVKSARGDHLHHQFRNSY